MSRVKTYLLDGLAVSTNGIINAQAQTAGVGITLEAGAAALSPPRRITFSTAGDLSGTEFTVFGTDANGDPQSESFTGLSSTAGRTTVNTYASVTRVIPNRTSATTVSAGWIVGAATPWILTGRGFGQDQKPEARCSAVTVSGAPTGNWEVTYVPLGRTQPELVVADLTTAWVSGTPFGAQGEAVRFVLTSAAGTSVRVKVNRPGPY